MLDALNFAVGRTALLRPNVGVIILSTSVSCVLASHTLTDLLRLLLTNQSDSGIFIGTKNETDTNPIVFSLLRP
jgi:hypothetical protein